jgi:hypothetical protein
MGEERRPTALRPVDELISDLEAGAGPVAVTPSKHCLDVDVLSDLHLDLPGRTAPADGLEEELARVLYQRYRKLREPFSEDSPKVVIVRGRRSFSGAADLDPDSWRSLLAALAPTTGMLLSLDPGEPAAATDERAAVFAVEMGGEDAPGEPFAHIAVLAWSGTLARDGGRGATGSEKLLRVLSGAAARNTPLHVLCVTDSDIHEEGFFRECERLRVSLVLSGALTQPDLVTVSRASLRSHRDPRSVPVVRCPSFKAGVATSGMTRVRFDLWKGEAEVAFRPDLGSDKPVEAVQVTSQLISASRITSAERRLYSHVDELLEEEEAPGERAAEVRAFRARVRDEWAQTGYVTLSDHGGELPIKTDRGTNYKLLLLARERPGGYDILLSNHSPLRPSLLSEWNTLLLPAFKDARALLEYLRDDVIRQIRQRAESFERVAHARAFEAAVERILADKEGWQGLWKDEIDVLDTREMTAISPTTGVGTRYAYELVTVRPLVEAAKPLDGELDGDAAQGQRDRRQIIEWLRDLDAVEIPQEGAATGAGLSLTALAEGGCGVRWDPDSGFAEVATPAERRRAETASPGTIWFPLAEPGEAHHWQACPSIVSRNADVMSWVEEVLERERDGDGRLPAKLLLGGA